MTTKVQSPGQDSEKKFNWSRPKLAISSSYRGPVAKLTMANSFRGPTRNVSFSDSSKSSRNRGASVSSRSSSPQTTPSVNQGPARPDTSRNWQKINRRDLALSPDPKISLDTAQPRPFLVYDSSFIPLLGPSPKLELLIEDQRAPFFHQAGVFIPKTNTLFMTSNLIPDPSPDAVTTANSTIIVTKIEFFSPTDFARDKVRCPERNYMAAGGTPYRDGLLLCAQGSLHEPAGLVYMEAKRPHKTTPLINNFHGRPFNSPRDVVVHSDGSIWFTDPAAGCEHGFRPKPQLPQHLYRFYPPTGDIRVVADGFGRPTGLCFSPDEQTLYVTDTHAALLLGDGGSRLAPTRAATIYAYTVLCDGSTGGSPFLVNRRLFAYVDAGVPEGVGCDVRGNVYAGCGDGLQVWNRGGVLIGKVVVEGGVGGLSFGRGGDLFLLGGKRLWRVGMEGGSGGGGVGEGLMV